MVLTVASDYDSCCTVQYLLQLINELLAASCQEAIAVVQPQNNETPQLQCHCDEVHVDRSFVQRRQRLN